MFVVLSDLTGAALAVAVVFVVEREYFPSSVAFLLATDD